MQGAGTDIGTGRLAAPVVDGDLRGLAFDGHEVLRRVSYPVRNADWGTCPTVTLTEEIAPGRYRRRFAQIGGLFDGEFRVDMTSDCAVDLSVRFHFARTARVNRVGFTVLHPLQDVAGEPMHVLHPDGRTEAARFPRLIAPGQPARDIAGLSHAVGPVMVTMTFSGEVFEMEDQRNWSDASFKTYCRPLALPRPFTIGAGETIRQDISLQFEIRPMQSAGQVSADTGVARLPAVLLAHEAGLSTTLGLSGFPEVPVLFRLDAGTPDGDLTALAGRRDVAVEIVFDTLDDLDRQAARLHRAGLAPVRVLALPSAYLASHQPEGPWPAGPAPRDAIAPLRAAFPGVPVGSGSLTNFTEFNRCPPDPSADFASFGSTAIVHAADDMSVRETIEALPAILQSAQALAPGKPLHLGLFSIGMRSNPYGSAVVPNPNNLLLPMVQSDPRQGTDFAAAHAVAILIQAARAGVQSLALAMPDGPLGAAGTRLAEVIRATAAAAGQEVRWRETGGALSLEGPGFAFTAKAGHLMEVAA